MKIKSFECPKSESTKQFSTLWLSLLEIIKTIVLVTLDAWSTIHLSKWTSKPAYHIVDWQIFGFLPAWSKEKLSLCCMLYIQCQKGLLTSKQVLRTYCQNMYTVIQFHVQELNWAYHFYSFSAARVGFI